jgi:hypothetical protein
MADEGMHVVVTIADNGVVHAWGEGPVVTDNPDEVRPFASRARARAVAAQMRREQKGTVDFRVCKVLGIESVEVKTT